MRLRTAYLGDSIAVHATRAKRPGGKGGQWDVTVLTDIHRPDRLDEEARILAAGGSVLPANAGCAGSPPRLLTPDYGLAMSRSFGDFHCASYGLSCWDPAEGQLWDPAEAQLWAVPPSGRRGAARRPEAGDLLRNSRSELGIG